MTYPSAIAPLLLLALTACGSNKDDTAVEDTSPADTSADDTGANDTGANDTGTTDTADTGTTDTADTGANDTGANDTGTTDTADTGTTDTADTGTTDTADTGTTDTADTGTTDTGGATPVTLRVSVSNHSFEALTGTVPGDYTTSVPDGWVFTPRYTGYGAIAGTFCPPRSALDTTYPLASPADGNNVLWMSGHAGGGTVSPARDLFSGEPYGAGTVVEARVAVAKRNDAAITGTGNAFISLTSTTGMSCISYDPTFVDLSASAGEWVEAWVRCTAGTAGTLSGGVSFGVVGLGNRNDQVLFDNVRVTVELLE